MPLQGLEMASVICLDANKMALPEIKRLIQRFLKEALNKSIFHQKQLSFQFFCPDFTSRESRHWSPIKLMASTTSIKAMPGARTKWGAMSK